MRYLSGVLLYSITLKVWPFTDRLSYLAFLNCVSILVKFLKCLISLCYGANMVFFFFHCVVFHGCLPFRNVLFYDQCIKPLV